MEKAANAVASLKNRPLTERRFLLMFPSIAQSIGKPGLAAELIELMQPSEKSSGIPVDWLENWEEAFIAAGRTENAPVKLNINRLSYYKSAILANKDEYPAAALWPAIKTWTLAASVLRDNPSIQDKWASAVSILGMGQQQMDARMRSLDAYLDEIEETLDVWAQEMGIVQE
jgi:hypothetical protein